MPKLDPIFLGPGQVPSADQWNRLQENIERALTGVSNSFTSTLNIISGGSGSGSGTAGIGPRTLTWGTQIIGTTSGSEFVCKHWRIQCGTPGALMVVVLTGDFRSNVGTSYFRIRIGGAKGVATGAIALTVTQPATGTGFVGQGIVRTAFPSPGGLQYLKITAMASADDNVAQIDNGYVFVNGGT